MRKATFLYAAMFFTALISQTARGEAKHVRLNLDTSLFHFQKTVYDFTENGYTDVESVKSFGFGDGGAAIDDDFGGNVSSFRLGVAGVLINRISIGLNLGLGGGKMIWKEEENDYGDLGEWKFNIMSFAVLPYFEYKFDIGMVQPYLMFTFGYSGFLMTEDDDDYKITVHSFVFGGGAGIHIFPAEAVSIDLGLTAKGNFGKLVNENTYEYVNYYSGSAGGRSVTEKEKYPEHGFSLNIVVGLSVWL